VTSRLASADPANAAEGRDIEESACFHGGFPFEQMARAHSYIQTRDKKGTIDPKIKVLYTRKAKGEER
jgi:hypothetical protein